ncbi:MAG: hypothetical protein A2103_04665 [Gammaproteobacteria bacterium GWF2_41_13]|nr:MAG: hypothetical protein A2103_04665 [Gammaproteobacteria bacterium GWF2_41_13]
MNILLVEDDLIAQKIAIKILESLGCQVLSARDGATALAIIQQQSFPIIFIDLGLPDIDGYRLADQIVVTLRAQQRSSYLIALSAYVSEEEMKRSQTVGVQQVLEKPLSFEKAKKIIGNYSVLSKECSSKI